MHIIMATTKTLHFTYIKHENNGEECFLACVPHILNYIQLYMNVLRVNIYIKIIITHIHYHYYNYQLKL